MYSGNVLRGVAASPPLYWDTRAGFLWGQLTSEGVFHLIFVVSPFLLPFCGLSPSSAIPPPMYLCSRSRAEQKVFPSLLKDVLWLNRYRVPSPSPAHIKRSWLLWGMFRIHDANRKETHPVKNLFLGMWDKSPMLQNREILGFWSKAFASSNLNELDFKPNACITWHSPFPFPISVSRLWNVRTRNHEICFIFEFSTQCAQYLTFSSLSMNICGFGRIYIKIVLYTNLRHWFSNLSMIQNQLESFLKHR